jgi:hypothetical protein
MKICGGNNLLPILFPILYSPQVKVGSIVKVLALVSALLLCGTGCGSFYAAPTISPLMFLLPGFVQTKPTLLHPPVLGQTATNWIMAQANTSLCDSHSR